MKKTVLVIENYSYYLEIECDKNTTNDEIEEKAYEMMEDKNSHINETSDINIVICEGDENE